MLSGNEPGNISGIELGEWIRGMNLGMVSGNELGNSLGNWFRGIVSTNEAGNGFRFIPHSPLALFFFKSHSTFLSIIC